MSSTLSSVPWLGMLGTLARLIILTALLAGLWLALQRTTLGERARTAAWLWVAAALSAWLAVVWELAVAGVFLARPGGSPALPIAILAPVLIGLLLLMRSERVAAAIDAIPPWWLVGLQAYRVFGGIFIARWAMGDAPGVWAIPAGVGDVLAGVLAIPVALALRSGAGYGRAVAYAWNIFGILDLVNAIALGALTSPGRLQMLAFDQPNVLVGSYPTVMVPAFGVPLSLILHGVSLWQLRRSARRIVAVPA